VVQIVPNMAADDALWYSIKDSLKATDFERYIKEFATGQYVIQAKEQLAKLKPTQIASTIVVDIEADKKALSSLRFLEELDEFVKGDAAPLTTLQSQIMAGSPLAKARYCALATHERFKLGLKAEAGINYCKELAEQGVGIGMVLYGRAFHTGSGVVKDETTAVQWFRKAAKQGNAAGQVGLGMMYFNGMGITKDEVAALAWFHKAADQGDAGGQVNLGGMYQYGKGVAKDEASAVVWYRKAAEQGNAAGQINLGAMYEHGTGIAKDEVSAVEWTRKAADQKDNASGSILFRTNVF
jgi:TPR repeat protein